MADFLLGGQIDPAAHQRTGTTTSLPSGDFTTHGVIVGMTGSGKTGLGVVLVEEALRAGIPALLVDPKGDLTNLCLTFPTLAATDFQPWVNESDAQKAGLGVAEFAAAQATVWTDGLAGWGLGAAEIGALRDAVTFTVYTPGSTSGIPVNIVGSLQAPPPDADDEVVGDEIEGFVSGLLSLVGIEADPLSSREHILLSNVIHHEWEAGRSLDLPTLVGMVQTPPVRKLGVFDLDAFYPKADRTAFAMRLNGLLASPSFATWMEGPALDIEAMMRTPDGRPRCAIVTTAHLSDEERQFVTTMLLSKLVTWMRRQSGTTDLRALLYMDEVAGYLPPTAMPPTKKPIMTLMKQARAFGVGVVLATQNPVDVDYKAISNAGTWMIGRLQTERDKQRLLDGMSAAAGGVDVGAVGDTISGLAKREFVLRRAGKDQPEVFTTRWAMSYLRGPLTRDQIATLMTDQKVLPPPVAGDAPSGVDLPPPPTGATAAPAPGTASPGPAPAPAGAAATGAAAASAPLPADDDLPSADAPVMPKVADGTAVRYVDLAAPWLGTIGADPRSTMLQAAAVARVALRYDDEKLDLVQDEEYEVVLTPLHELLDVAAHVAVDYDDRDLVVDAPAGARYLMCDARIDTKAWWTKLQRDLVDHLVRSRVLTLAANREMKLVARPGEAAEAFATRCLARAEQLADDETAKLKDKYEAKLDRIRQQLQTAEDRASVLEREHEGKRNEELLSTMGSVLGGILGGRRSRGGVFGNLGRAAGRRGRTAAANERLDAAQGKVQGLSDQLIELQGELENEMTAIDVRWSQVARGIGTVDVPLEKSDVKVTQVLLAWIPVTPP